MAKILLPVTEKEFNEAGSKFITFSPDDKVGKLYQYKVEVGTPYWKTAGKSLSFPVTITEGVDTGKKDELFAGVEAGGVWKVKEIAKNVTGKLPEMMNGKPVIDTDDYEGKPATGIWQIQEGHKDGDPNAPMVKYPKLISLLSAASGNGKTESA